jgi:hypothetical protein
MIFPKCFFPFFFFFFSFVTLINKKGAAVGERESDPLRDAF